MGRSLGGLGILECGRKGDIMSAVSVGLELGETGKAPAMSWEAMSWEP